MSFELEESKRLIDANALLTKIVDEECYVPSTGTALLNIRDVLDIITNMPTVEDMEPVRHGEWIKREWINPEMEMRAAKAKAPTHYCSQCGAHGYENYKRCPECGAKMDGGADNEEKSEIQQENLQELVRLIKENPELPIVPMVNGEIVCGDEYGYWVGRFGKAEVDEYLMPTDGREDDGIYFKSDDDVFDVLERYLPEEEWEALPEKESECRPYFEALPWIKAIIVYIELPE